MTPWQVLHAGRAAGAARGHLVHRGAAGSVQYSPGSAAGSAPADGCRSFCLSREKVALQQLNERLASYLQQVHSLEAANQMLETQIQLELDRKCPRELRHLDTHLRTVSLLRTQINEDLAVQAQLKLQLLNAELCLVELSLRCENERKRRRSLEEELSKLRLLEEDLQIAVLPGLQDWLNRLTEQTTELQIRHQQNRKALLAQMSGGITVNIQPAEPSDLIQQLEDLRWTNEMLLEETQRDGWSNNQVSLTSSPAVTFDPPAASEVFQAELEQLKRTVMMLEAELTQLEAQKGVLEVSAREQEQSLVQEMVVLEQSADVLCADLESVLQATTRQAADHQTLLDIKTQLENEIQDYRKLLDGLDQLGVSGFYPTFAAPFVVATLPSTTSRNVTVSKIVSFQRASVVMEDVQPLCEGYTAIRQIANVTPHLETVTTRVSDKHPCKSELTSTDTSANSFLKPENRKSSSAEVRSEYPDSQESSVVCAQIIQTLDEGGAIRDSEPNNERSVITTLVADTQAEPEGQTATEDCLQVHETESKTHSVITRTTLELNQAPQVITQPTLCDVSDQTAAEQHNETETLAAPWGPQGPTQTEEQDRAQVVTVSLAIEEEACKTERNGTVTVSVSGSDILTSEETQDTVSDKLVLIDENHIKNQENKEEDTLTILRLDQSSQPSHMSPTEQNKVMENAHNSSSIAAASSIILDSDETLESEVKIKLVPGKPLANGTHVQAQTQTNKKAVFLDDKTETNAPVERRETAPHAEVKQGEHSLSNVAMVDDSKLTASQEESETAALIQTSSTQVSTQTQDQDQGQLVPVSLDIQNEVDGNAGIVAVTASCIPVSGTVTSEEAQATVSVEATLINENQEEKQEGREVEVQSVVLRVDQSSAIEQNKAVEDADKGSSAATAPSDVLGADNGTDITGKLERMTSNQTTTDTGMQDNNPETVVTETQLEGNPGPQSVTELETADSSKQAATDKQREPEPVAKGIGTEASWDRSQNIAQVVSFSLKTTVEMEEEEEEAALTVSGVSGPHLLTSEEAQDTACGELTLIVEEDVETQEKVGEEKAERPQLYVGFGISASSSGEQNKVLEEPNAGSNDASDPIKSVEENFKELAQDILVSTTDSRQHLRSTDLTLSSSSTKEAHSSKEAQVSWSQGEPDSSVSPEMSSSPAETDILINMANQGFYPVDAQGEVRSLDSFLSPNGPSPCLSPLEAQLCHSPNSEEERDDEELHLTEAKVNIRPVEKYVLLTKEDEQSPSFSGSQDLQEADGDRHVRISVTDYNKKKEKSSSTLNATETCGPATLETGHQLSGRLEGSALQGTGGCSVTADREQTLPLESFHKCTEENKDVQNQGVHPAGQYNQQEVSSTEDEVKGQKSCETASFDGVSGTSGDLGSMATSNEGKASDGAASGETAAPSSGEVSVDDRGEQKLNSGSLGQTGMSLPKSGSKENLPEGIVSAVSQEENRSVGSKGSVEWHIYGSNLGFKSSLDDITTLAIEGEEKKSRVVTNPSEVSNEKGRFGGGEWIVYSGGLGRKRSLSMTRSEDSPLTVVLPNTTSTETRSGSVGNDDPMADRGLKSSNSPAGSDSLPSTENREGHPKAMQQTSNPPGGGGRFGREEWRVYGASPGQIRSWNSSDSLTRADKEEVATVPTNLASPQRSVGLRRLGSVGSGEWRVYGGSTERISSWSSGKSLPMTDKEEVPIVTANLTSQPGSVGIRRLGSGGSGEWRVYGGSTERISSWASGKSLPKADKEEVAIVTANLPTSPTESLGTGSFGRGGSGEWRVYGGSTGRVSSWVSSNSLPNAGKEVIPAVSANLATSPPGSQGAGRFGSGSSGEWRVYGGSTGRLSCASSLEKISVRANQNHVISPPSSHTTSSSRLGAGSAGRLSSGSSGSGLSSSSASQRISTTGRYASTGSSERKPVYSPASTRKNSAGSGSKLTSQSGAKISSSSRSGGTNSTGGRVIISSNRPIRSTGSGTGGNKERISVCKMAALSIAAAGRERGQDQQRQRQQRRQQDAGSAAVGSSLLQRWLNTGEQCPPADDDVGRL